MINTYDSLAIVIPAYKINYLDLALASVASQTNTNFNVYICDDGSPDDIKSIADKYTGQISLHYYRFPNNLGKTNLVKHWNRSVSLANEKWIWLFSDDDVISPLCAQAFFNALSTTTGQHDLYRFNIEMIDGDGKIICVKEPHPTIENGYQFLKRRLQSKSLSAGVEYIFKKSAFEKNGGFVQLPLAWCSDDASWIQFAGNKAIYTIQSAKIYWRASGLNLSSAPGFKKEKLDALIKFIYFIVKKFPDKKYELLSLSEGWFFENLNYLNGRLKFWQLVFLLKRLTILFGGSIIGSFKKLLAFQLRNTRFATGTYKWLKY